MYRCYCKIMKKLNELEKEIQTNYAHDDSLSQKVTEIRQDLNANTQADRDLENRVEVIETTGGGGGEGASTATEGDIDTLFP